MRRLLALTMALALSGCATAHPLAPAACVVPVKTYSKAELGQMAEAVRSLPETSPLRNLVVDYQRLRDEARAACAPPPK